MHAIALTHDQLRAVATLTAFASRDDVTHVITGVRITLEDGRVIATATDRYRVAEISFPINPTDDALDTATEQDTEFPGVTIPATFLARVVKQLPRRPLIPNPTIALITDDETHRITIRDRLAGFDVTDTAIRGNYPPVARLFPGTLETVTPHNGPVRLNATYLAALEKLSLPSDIGTRGAVKCYELRTQTSENPNKPAPVIFTRNNGSRTGALETIRALVQPHLILR